MTQSKPIIGIIGGTGALGSGLAGRWVAAGYQVLVGSRAADKAVESAGRLASMASGPVPRGMTNLAAARDGEILVVTVPYASASDILDEIRSAAGGKIVVDTTVPLMPPKVARVQLPAAGSAALASQARLGDGVRVVAAFHNVAAHKIQGSGPVDCDVLVFGDKADDRDAVIALVMATGLRGLHAGPLQNSVAGEALTSVLIGMNRTYKADGAGIRITGIP
ncbi:MAG: NADPH-dependent F420 reductase [Rhodospirillales bacterium]|nr:NADPH-dependent F420 reductase [Rhodospirillales bacterium]